LRCSTVRQAVSLMSRVGSVFADLPGAQRVIRVWHFPDKGFGSADVPAAAGGGVVPGETIWL
jgi:hypothetical protein